MTNTYNKLIILFMVVAAVLGVGLLHQGEGFYASAYIENFNDQDFRISGGNRYETAGEIARKNGAFSERVIIVRGDSVDGVPQVVDGLTASALAGVKNAQILLVAQDHLPASTEKIIKSLGAKEAIIVGGTAAVGESVEEEIKALGLTVERIQGGNRFETAANVAREIGGAKDRTAIIVNGNSEVDSLVAGPLAYGGYPILMVNNARGTIPEATMDALEELHIENLLIVGGTAVVSEELEVLLGNLPNLSVKERYGGRSRVQTSIALAGHQDFQHRQGVSLVNGASYVDAVAASTLGEPVIYFMERTGIETEIEEFLEGKSHLYAIGGNLVISNEILIEATPIIGFEHYATLYRHNPSNTEYRSSFMTYATNLLRRGQKVHSEGNLEKAMDHYERMIKERDLLSETLKKATDKSRERALLGQTILGAKETIEHAGNMSNITERFNTISDGAPLYWWDSNYRIALRTAGEDLLAWSIRRHNEKQFTAAIIRYEVIIQGSEGIDELQPVSAEAKFYLPLAENGKVWTREQLNMRFSRYRDSIRNALDQQIEKNSHTVRNGTSWVSPSTEDVSYYLNSRNFYEANWLEDDTAPEFIQIATTSLRMRSGPSTSYAILDLTYRNEIYPVLGESNGWFRIQKNGVTGWVQGSYVHRISKNAGISNLRVEVTASALNVRKGPSTGYERIGIVSAGERFSIQEHKNGWHKIHYHGMAGWISGNFTKVIYEIPAETYQFLELTNSLNLSADEMNRLVGNDQYLHGSAETFRSAGKQYNINEIYLAAHGLMESEGLSNELVKGIRVTEVDGQAVTPRTVYNVFGIGAVGSNPVKAGAEFAYEQGWTSREAAITQGTRWLSEKYIHHPKIAQDTLYKMRWDPSRNGENPFNTDIQWAKELGGRLEESYRLLDYDAVKFDLSVYKTRAWPVPGHTRISSPYGYRIHPFTGQLSMHIGIDIPAPAGTPIVAAKSGIVTVSHLGTSYGYWIEINHGDGITTRYAHNSQNLVKKDDWVEKGEVIALVGTTGTSTGNHLHFEVRHNNNHFNPLTWLQGN